MIGSEVLFGAGLVSRELTLLDGRLTIHFRAGPGLQSRLKALSNTGRAEPPENHKMDVSAEDR
jgi:hypothetical protein